MHFLEQVFSIKNDDIKKVITFFGIKIKFKSKKLIERKRLENIENRLKKINEKLKKQKEKIEKQKENVKKQSDLIKKQSRTLDEQAHKLAELQQKQNSEKHKMNLLQQKVNPIIQSYIIPHINKEKVDYSIEMFDKFALNQQEKRDKRVIVSLTSYPDRMYDIHYCLYSLLNQTFKPDKIILYLTKEQFPNLEKDIPQKVLNFCELGLAIKWCNENIKSFTKLIPALREFPDDIIVTADDDIYYERDWLQKLYDDYLKNGMGGGISAHRCHKVTINNGEIMPYSKWKHCIQNDEPAYDNFLTGVGGVLYPPNVLHPDIFNMDLFMQLTPQSDDIWFWAMAILNNTKINIVKNPYSLIYVNPQREFQLNGDTTLYSKNRNDNDKQIAALLDYYPQIKQKLFAISDD